MVDRHIKVSKHTDLVGLLTVAMAAPMLVLYAIGALGPSLLAEFDLPRSMLGALVSGSFGVAAAVSLWAGGIVDRVGVRAGLLGVFLLSAMSFLLMLASRGFVMLAVAVAVSGLAQALANPVTNRVIAERLPPAARGSATGVKQSGVQLAALGAGAALPALAAATDWRVALGAGAPLALLAAVVTPRVLRRHGRGAGEAGGPSAGAARPRLGLHSPSPFLAWLIAYQLFLGVGLATLNTFLPLYTHESLHVAATSAALLIAVFGVAGIVARISWSRRANGRTHLAPLLAGLALAAGFCAVVLWGSRYGGVTLVVLGTIGIGATAVAANAISMLLIVRDRRTGPIGHASALASMGFFAGFAVGPPLLGSVADARGFGLMWLLLALQFFVSAAIATRLRVHELNTRRAGEDPAGPAAEPASAPGTRP